MKQRIITILAIFCGHLIFGQSDCNEAKLKAEKDFKEEKYVFHSLESLPLENTYRFVLREDYDIQWQFISPDSLRFYDCYDSTLTTNLKSLFGDNFLDIVTKKADSLEKLENWRKEAEFPGGNTAMLKFINDSLTQEKGNLEENTNAKVTVRFDISEKGRPENLHIVKGINEEIDNRVIKIFENMPKWSPTYIYGKPVKRNYTLTFKLEKE